MHYFSQLNTFMRKGKDPDPDPDPWGQKTSGSPTLVFTNNSVLLTTHILSFIFKIPSLLYFIFLPKIVTSELIISYDILHSNTRFTYFSCSLSLYWDVSRARAGSITRINRRRSVKHQSDIAVCFYLQMSHFSFFFLVKITEKMNLAVASPLYTHITNICE